MDGLILSLLLLLQDPKDRLAEAIREAKLKEAEAALADLAAGDGAKAARALILLLPKARDRQAALLASTVAARQAYDNTDTSFAFNIEEERLKQRTLAKGKERIKESCRIALEGEKIHAAMLATLRRLKEGAIPVLAAEALRTGSWILKCELLEGLGALGAREAVLAAIEREPEPAVLAAGLAAISTEKALAHLGHPQWQVRLAAARALREVPQAVGPVVDALPAMDLRLRNSACAGLAALTKTDLPADPAAWRDWWKANGEDFAAGRYAPQERKELKGPGRTTFYDVPVSSSRVCFLIDRSPSMKELNRFEAACRELKRLLEELPDGSRVNIIFFGGTTSLLSASPTRPLDRVTRRDALQFVDRMGYESGTDLYGALEKALALVGSPESGRLREEGPDTLIVLSDGVATVGRLVDDELVARVIARRARYLRPVIHTISLTADARSLKILSDLTGGEYKVK